jgi:riboflavin kinase/FMN adenylyltransferase
MKIWNGIESYPEDGPAVVATIGNYDGVHLGHQAIVRSVVESARRGGHTSVLITFEPHPLSVVAPERRPRQIQTRRQKLESLEATGLDGVLILPFDTELASLSGEEFFSRILSGPLRFSAIHVGSSFRFGRHRIGDVELLRTIGKDQGFEVVGVAPVRVGDHVVSSSTVRKLVEDGEVRPAHEMLGRPFSVAGEVVEGDGRGTAMRFPTANVDAETELLPHRGVYVTETVALATRHASVSNVGIRPTFNGGGVVVETHLLSYEGDLYGERIEVRFLERLRDERRFSGPEELADQIARDRAAAEAYFQNLPLAAS